MVSQVTIYSVRSQHFWRPWPYGLTPGVFVHRHCKFRVCTHASYAPNDSRTQRIYMNCDKGSFGGNHSRHPEIVPWRPSGVSLTLWFRTSFPAIALAVSSGSGGARQEHRVWLTCGSPLGWYRKHLLGMGACLAPWLHMAYWSIDSSCVCVACMTITGDTRTCVVLTSALSWAWGGGVASPHQQLPWVLATHGCEHHKFATGEAHHKWPDDPIITPHQLDGLHVWRWEWGNGMVMHLVYVHLPCICYVTLI